MVFFMFLLLEGHSASLICGFTVVFFLKKIKSSHYLIFKKIKSSQIFYCLSLLQTPTIHMLVHLTLTHSLLILCLVLSPHSIFSPCVLCCLVLCSVLYSLLSTVSSLLLILPRGTFHLRYCVFHFHKFDLYLFILTFLYFLKPVKYIYGSWLASLLTNSIICVISGSVSID